MRVRTIVGLSAVAIIAVVVYGVHRSAAGSPTFWQNFLPNLWANIIGVTVAAVIGVPIGFAVNQYILRWAESRHRDRQVDEVITVAEQVRRELGLHLTTLQMAQAFYSAAAAGRSGTGRTTSPSADSIAGLVLQDVFGKQFIVNRSVLDIGERLLLFQVSNYYARVDDLNRILNWRIQDASHADMWDRRIEGFVATVSLARAQLDYEIEQAAQRLRASRA